MWSLWAWPWPTVPGVEDKGPIDVEGDLVFILVLGKACLGFLWRVFLRASQQEGPLYMSASSIPQHAGWPTSSASQAIADEAILGRC